MSSRYMLLQLRWCTGKQRQNCKTQLGLSNTYIADQHYKLTATDSANNLELHLPTGNTITQCREPISSETLKSPSPSLSPQRHG